MSSPFDFLNAINMSKEDLFKKEETAVTAQKDYVPYIVNMGLSYFPDTCVQANEMNKRHYVPKEWQFQFLLNSITRKKRFSKWHKQEDLGENLNLVMRYYDYSREKARVALSVLTDEQLSMIKQKFEKGGRI
jgi:hypothetical protein